MHERKDSRTSATEMGKTVPLIVNWIYDAVLRGLRGIGYVMLAGPRDLAVLVLGVSPGERRQPRHRRNGVGDGITSVSRLLASDSLVAEVGNLPPLMTVRVGASSLGDDCSASSTRPPCSSQQPRLS